MNGKWLSSVRSNGKYFFDLFTTSRVRIHILKAIPFWVASLITGLLAVSFTKMFSWSEEFLQTGMHWHRWIIFIAAPTSFVLAWLVVYLFAPNARGSGIPQVMAALDLSNPKYERSIDKLLNFRILVVKIISSLLMVLGGGAIGREGPTIQIAASVFRIVNKMLPQSWPKLSKQSFILTGAAAGLAAAFNTPLGGVVFAMEELAKIHVRFFRTALFTAVIIAGLTAQGILGPYLYLGYPDIQNIKFSIFLAVAITAIAAGLLGALTSKGMLVVMNWKKSFNTVKTVAFIVVAGLVVAFLAYFINDSIVGSGRRLMTTVLFTTSKYTYWHTIVMRCLGSIICFNTGAAGGVFAPALAAGASVGSYIASLFHFIGSNANILILSGMVGFLTGVTRTPFTSAILVLEMTDRHSVIFHLMLAAMLSNFAALIIDKHSFYEHLKKKFLQEAIAEEEKESSGLIQPQLLKTDH
jgi:H+/Cl- antiporter ClcA